VSCMLKILLFGKNGQLGWELQRCLAPLGDVAAFDMPEVDFTQPESLRQLIEQVRADVIVNPAAYTAVDKAESDVETAQLVNADAVVVLAQAARAMRVPLIHFSTDYVFDGSKGSPYVEADIPNPLNVYGRTKLTGEKAVIESGGAGLVLRTSWVYSMRQGGFVTKVLAWAKKNPSLRIVADQISGPTSARMLAEATALMLAQAGKQPYEWLAERAGIYHVAGDGYCSRFEWAEAILKYDPDKSESLVREMLPALTGDFPSPAERPLESVLCCDKFEATFGLRLPPWEEALRLMMEAE